MFAQQISSTERSTAPPTVIRRDGAEARAGTSLSVDRQLAVAREMAGALETLTFPGQLDNMSRIVRVIEGAGAHLLRNASLRNQRAFAQVLAGLKVECQRRVPDTETFRGRAEDLIALLIAAA